MITCNEAMMNFILYKQAIFICIGLTFSTWIHTVADNIHAIVPNTNIITRIVKEG